MRFFQRLGSLLVAVIVAVGACASIASTSSQTLAQIISGQSVLREYAIRYPQVPDQSSYPVVFFFHGAGASSGLNLLNTQLENLIDTDEFIGVFPTGYDPSGSNNNRWNVTGETLADDVEFFELILSELAADPLIDLDRVYAIGRSNGAGMVNKLGKQKTGLLKGIAPIVSQQVESIGALAASDALSVFQVNGDADNVIPIGGGFIAWLGATFLSAQASAENWAASLNCGSIPQSEQLLWGDLSVQAYTYPDCIESRQVRYHAVEGATHSMSLGQGFDLYAEVWSFFKAQESLAAESVSSVTVPAVGSFGLLTLGSSMLGLGAFQVRRR